ncbi:MAG: nucleotidyltransferase family protein [Verrucomicrobiota bacterium]
MMTSIAEQMRISGLPERHLAEMREIFARFPEVEEVRLFGSRAKGCADRGSDVDLAVFGTAVNDEVIFHLNDILSEQSFLPYFFDVIDYARLDDNPLKAHIDRVGLPIYQR